MIGFLKTTIIGGIVFLVPVVLLGMVALKAVNVMAAIAKQFDAFYPVESIGGMAVANIIAIVFVALVCFLAGLVARTNRAVKIMEMAESAVLERLPGYTLIKAFTNNLDPKQVADLHCLVVNFDESSFVAFEIERLSDGRVVIYIPDAPAPWTGSVHIVAAERVERLNVPVNTVMTYLQQMGRHSEDLMQKNYEANQTK